MGSKAGSHHRDRTAHPVAPLRIGARRFLLNRTGPGIGLRWIIVLQFHGLVKSSIDLDSARLPRPPCVPQHDDIPRECAAGRVEAFERP